VLVGIRRHWIAHLRSAAELINFIFLNHVLPLCLTKINVTIENF